jgi:iron complex outermembrane receptor protein
MKRASLAIAILAACSAANHAAGDTLEEMSLEDLVKADITSVARKSQSLADVPAAAFVITAEDIRRSGAQALPDVLRMAPGIQVAQIDNGRYAVTARSFNGRFANKLQVLVDGRSLYHPLFAGVTWELDPVPLEDIERIEIIRGAGAVMWGANAVNGVINIITRHTRNQTGAAVSVTAGSQGTADLYARVGQAVSDSTSWKLSAQARHIEPSRQYASAADSVDRLNNAVIDFRLDHDLGAGRDLSIQANASRSKTTELWNTQPDFSQPGLNLSALTPNQVLSSESLVGRYRWLGDSGIESSLQASLNRSTVDIDRFVQASLTTVDLDYQGRFAVDRHDILWGMNHRSTRDETSANEPYVAINGRHRTQRDTGIFIHDDWTLLPEQIKLGAGIRVAGTTANGTNLSTNATLLWTPSRSDSLWLKYASAPRTSARAERDVSILTGASVVQTAIPVPPFTANIPVIGYVNATGELAAEKSQGVELGYRKQISTHASADINVYRYRYTDLRSGRQTGMFGCHPLFALAGIPVDASKCAYFGLPLGTPVLFNEMQTINGLAAWNDGVEISADWLVVAGWRLQFSYSWSRLKADRGSNAVANEDGNIMERAAPRHHVSLRSQWNITPSQQFDLWLRGTSGMDRLNLVDTEPSASGAATFTRIPGYATVDLRYAYRVNKDLEFALIGRNLVGRHRLEYLSDYIPTAATEIAPTWLLSTHWRF